MIRSFRAALSSTLEEFAEQYPNMVVLNADCSRALMLSEFTKKYPHRMISVGISEADMVSMAAGFSTAGMIPIVTGFSMFVTEKPFEQIRQSIAYPNLNVKIIATHAGLCVGKDGATHQALEDIAIMRTLPNFKVFVASDINETKAALKEMLKHQGPCYLRLGRDLAEDVHPENKTFYTGGSDLLVEGKDCTVAACGLMVKVSLDAAELLRQENIHVNVVNIYSVKPIDKERILSCAEKTGAFVSVEDHTVMGGLGSAISEILIQNKPVPMEFVGVNDTFGESGDQDELFEKYGLTPKHVAKAVKRAIRRKNS